MRIVGYTYRAEHLCPGCLIASLPTGEGETFDGWADCSTPPMSPEDDLTELSYAFGFDRDNEYSFDSDDFPKVIFSTMIDPDERCTTCNDRL